MAEGRGRSAIACSPRREIILGGWLSLFDLRARAPNLKWFHQRPAGASNLLKGDIWGSDVAVTTSRGSGNTLAIAEYAVAGILHIAKSFHRVALERDEAAFNERGAYAATLLAQGKNVQGSSAPAGSGWRSVGSAPRSACA